MYAQRGVRGLSEKSLVALALLVLVLLHVGGVLAHELYGKTLLEVLGGISVGEPMTKLERLYLITGYFAIVALEVGLVLWLTPRVGIMRRISPFPWVILIAILLTNCFIIPRAFYIDLLSPSVSKKIPSEAASAVAQAVGAEKLKSIHVALVADKAYTIRKLLVDLGVPLSIALLLASIDLRAIARTIGVRPFLIFLAGSTGTLLGGYAVVAIISHVPGFEVDAIKAVACKVAAWIGGSENDAALFGMLKPGGEWYAFHRIAGSVAYSLYVALVFGLAGTGFVRKFDSLVKPKYNARVIAEQYKARAGGEESEAGKPRKITERELMLVAAFSLMVLMVSLLLEVWAGPKGIRIGNIPIPTVILATTFAILAATLIPGVKNLPLTHSLGMWLLYIIVTVYISDVTNLYKMAGKAYWVLVFFAAYWVLLAVHLGVITLAARILRVDWTTTAVASIANIGGAVTAPICASVYEVPELVPVAVVMASIGYALANYLAYFLFAVPLNSVFPGVIPTG